MSVSSNVIKCNDDLYTYNEEVERGQTKKKKNNEKTICMIWYSAPEGAVFLACLLFYWRKRRPMRSSGECASVCVRACVYVCVCVCPLKFLKFCTSVVSKGTTPTSYILTSYH